MFNLQTFQQLEVFFLFVQRFSASISMYLLANFKIVPDNCSEFEKVHVAYSWIHFFYFSTLFVFDTFYGSFSGRFWKLFDTRVPNLDLKKWQERSSLFTLRTKRLINWKIREKNDFFSGQEHKLDVMFHVERSFVSNIQLNA